jgi:hypothetical protein
MPDSPRYARALLVFAVLGVFFALDIGALLHAGCFKHDGPILPTLLVVVPIATSIAGLTIAWSAARRTRHAFLAAVTVILLLATATGATVGVFWWPPQGVVLGAGNGFGFGVAALVVLLPFWSALSVRARRGSVLDLGDVLVSRGFSGTTIAVSSIGLAVMSTWAKARPAWSTSPSGRPPTETRWSAPR